MVCTAIEAKPKILPKDEQLTLSVVLILPTHLNTKFNKYLSIIIHKDIIPKPLTLNNQLRLFLMMP